ncbi:MAG TPA: reverse transcriptase/maturase family protein [Flavobacteriaceae bacterium]|nr:reverse transcriptase/maturase family protein [Flavobacteriaceae bacterium]
MKRVGYIYNKIYCIKNLKLADERARINKTKRKEVKKHDENREANLQKLHVLLKTGKYKTSEYQVFKVYKPKEREISKLPYYPDRIVHHAIMNIMEPIWTGTFTADTYSCIKGRGIHALSYKLRTDLANNIEETKYCLQMDIKKFYPSINHNIMLEIIEKKVKDKYFINFISEIIRSADGLPIGNYLSQCLSNLYLTYFDHWIKQVVGVKYYYRYADDMVILLDSKEELWEVFRLVQEYLKKNLKLEIKENYQVFPVEKRGIDVVGYVHYHTHTLMRKSIKKSMAKAVKANKEKSIAAYYGWAKHADTKNLLRTLELDNYGNKKNNKRRSQAKSY